MVEENIKSLKARHESLGFGPLVEVAIRSQLLFQKESFDIRHTENRDGDTCMVTVHCATEKTGSQFDCIYYDVVLRKPIVVIDEVIEGISVGKLDSAMADIKWTEINPEKVIAVSDRLPSLEHVKTIALILLQLAAISVTPHGSMIANRLKYKYWVDTSLESFIQDFAAIRYQQELCQRYFFFEDDDPISISEAYRFLKSRWAEKQFALKRKQTAKSTDVFLESGLTKPSGTLLGKRGRGGSKGVKNTK